MPAQVLDQPSQTAESGALLEAPEADRFWTLYRSTRLLALTRPVSEEEEEILAIIARRMEQALGLDPAEAGRQATRALFAYRDEWLHGELALELPPADIARLLDTIAVDGLDQIAALPP